MKQLLILNLILLVLVALNVRAGTPVPAPTPVTPSVIKAHAMAPAQTLRFHCPDKIGVAPAPTPAGWQSLGNVTRHRQLIDVDAQKHMVVCWYGIPGDTNFLISSIIGQTYPPDYECKIPSPSAYTAVCNKKIRIIR